METTQSKETTQNKSASTFKVTGNWEAQSKALKSQFNQLTDADLKLEAGKDEEMLSRVQTSLGKNREDVIAIIKKGQLEKV
jgi:uncharacterized protein YjbJ (UPF0337 family)